jgi:hypothetical protein
MNAVKEQSQRIFTDGMMGPHSGQIRSKRNGGGRHQASAAGEYPANDTGGLLASMRSRVTSSEVTIGTDVFYAKFLREGTGQMARRKMSDNALTEGGKRAKPFSRGWVAWIRG